MTLIEYLRIRHPTVNSITRAEANILGISYPLQAGWVYRYNEDIPYETVCELVRKMNERKATVAYKQAKDMAKQKKSKNHVDSKCTIDSLATKLIKNGCLSKKENEQLLFMQFSNKKTTQG